MPSQSNVPDKIVQDYFNNPAAFTVYFTNLWYDSDGTPQRPYEKQLRFLNGKNFPNITVVTKCRQSGFSSACVAKIVHNSYFGKRPEFMIMSRTKNQAAKVLRRIRSAFNSMPEYMQPEFEKETETQLILPNNSVIYSLSARPESARGFTGDVYLDEFGTFGTREGYAIWTAIAPATTKGYDIFVVGTPQGKGNLFFDLSTKTLSEFSGVPSDNDSHRMKVHWSEVPHINKNIDNIRPMFSPMMFEQEYELSFLDETEDIYFSREFITNYLIDGDKDESDLIKFLNVWDRHTSTFRFDENNVPESAKFHHIKDKYSETYIGWDIAREHDCSIITVIGKKRESDSFEVIALERFKKIDYTVQSKIVSIAAQLFFANRVGFDNTGLGGAVKNILEQTKIRYIIHPVNFSKSWKAEAYQNIRTMMYQGKFKAPEHAQMIHEFVNLQFDPVTNRIEAATGENDDIPSSFIIALDAARKKRTSASFGFFG